MKRFTETDKWRDPWFRKLSAGAKLAFYYIVENCDNSGVWTPDKELADFSIGMAIPWDKVLEAFGDRIQILSNGDWLIKKFVQFQYGELSETCKPHLQVIRLIQKHTLSKGYPKSSETLEETDKDKDKYKTGSPEGGGNGHRPIVPTLEQAKAFAPSAGVDPRAAECWWLDCDSRGLSPNGYLIDAKHAEIRNWQSALTSYGRKWQSNDAKNGKHHPEMPKPPETFRADWLPWLRAKNHDLARNSDYDRADPLVLDAFWKERRAKK